MQLFTAWQEACRKDIERAFGVLQSKFQVLARPMLQINLTKIANKVATCMILHNMCVSDRVMGDERAHYNPAFNLEQYETDVEVIDLSQPKDLQAVQASVDKGKAVQLAITGIRNATTPVQKLCIRRQLWHELKDEAEHSRLHSALMSFQLKNK